jgi:DNA-binding LacI/PurR family transcriptional regulator/signal transduction histidine kinase/ActR/RegA family two-component response regulator
VNSHAHGVTVGGARFDMSAARKTIGVLIDYVDYINGGYEGRLRAAFEAEAARLDLDLFIFVGRPLRSPEYEAQNGVFQLAHADCVDGLIVVAAGLGTFTGAEGVRKLCAQYGSLPLCSLGLELPGVPSVVLDNRAGMEALLEHLYVEHGCRRMAYIGGPENNPDSRERKQVIEEFLARHGLSLDPACVAPGVFTLPSGAEAMSVILQRTRDIDVVLAANDGMALGAQDELKRRGLRVPQQIRVVGFDDLDIARFASPPLTTVCQPLERMAVLSIQTVTAQLRGEAVPERIFVGAELVSRRSCGCTPFTQRLWSSKPAESPSSVGTRAQRLADQVTRELGALGSAAPATAQTLLSGLAKQRSGETDGFLAALEGVLETSGENSDLHEQLQSVITLLRAESAPSDQLQENVWHEARALVARSSERAKARQRMNVDVAYWHLLRSGERLLTAFDLSSLRDVLAEELPAMHVQNAVFSLYCDGTRRELEPFFCLRDGVPVDPGVARFPATQLVPPGMHPKNRHMSFVWPLAADLQQFGVAVLEGMSEVGTHEMLGEQVSAALKSATLHREIVHRTALHERSIQERLATAKRMSALSVLAGGVAHDLNNSLGPLVALPDIILHELDYLAAESSRDQSELRADVTAIKSAALRAAQTIRDLLTTARQGRTNKEVFDLNRAVESCVTADSLALASGPSDVEVGVELSDEALFVYGSESQLGRALSNLLRNAAEAIAVAGRVKVKTAAVRVSERIMGYEAVEPGEYVVVTVSDDGRGIPEPELGRIFEPFFSNKRQGESSGSGLGLAIVHGVVKEHDGFVNVESAVGRGTTFTLYFARAKPPQLAREERRLSSAPPGPRAGRILVVDDDPVQLRTAQRVLERAGHRVVTTRGGREAQVLFEAAQSAGKSSPYDLLILDMVLNELDDGLVVFERIARIYPDQRCLIVSGHAPTDRGLLAIERGLDWLAKPYTSESLVQAVARALDPLRGDPKTLRQSRPPVTRKRTGT